MNGIIIVNKPKGWTSFDVVAKIRSLTRVKRVGHSGTLDPMATGVLPVFLGRATKDVQYFMEGDKGYEGEMVLGVKTDTGDAEGKVVNQPSPPNPLSQGERGKSCPRPLGEGRKDCQTITINRVRAVMQNFTGEIEQVPPMHSAVKVKGKRLYELARKGIEVKREPRKVTIYALRITQDDSQLATAGRIAFSVICSKGTYIRQLVVDIGDELGCGAHLSKLTRTYAHPFHISQAIDMDVIVTLAQAGILSSVVLDPAELLEEMNKVSNG
jgi:tRNA pseudouridine55 synthase